MVKHEDKIRDMLKELEGRMSKLDRLMKEGLPEHVDNKKLEEAYDSIRQYSLKFSKKR
jgi:hypothetical protein